MRQRAADSFIPRIDTRVSQTRGKSTAAAAKLFTVVPVYSTVLNISLEEGCLLTEPITASQEQANQQTNATDERPH